MELFAGGVTMIQLDNFFGSFIDIAPLQFNLGYPRWTRF